MIVLAMPLKTDLMTFRNWAEDGKGADSTKGVFMFLTLIGWLNADFSVKKLQSTIVFGPTRLSIIILLTMVSKLGRLSGDLLINSIA